MVRATSTKATLALEQRRLGDQSRYEELGSAMETRVHVLKRHYLAQCLQTYCPVSKRLLCVPERANGHFR